MTFFQRFFLSLLVFSTSALNGEVETIALNWNPGLCVENCGQLLKQEFSKLQEVESIDIDLPSGRAVIRWNPRSPFSYVLLDRTMRRVGLGIHYWRLVVRGYIHHDPENVWLISQGDDTRFNLINPVVPLPNQMNIQHNLANRILTPEMRDKLLTSEKNQELVTIEGPLFDPWRSPFNYFLIVEQVKTPPPTDER